MFPINTGTIVTNKAKLRITIRISMGKYKGLKSVSSLGFVQRFAVLFPWALPNGWVSPEGLAV